LCNLRVDQNLFPKKQGRPVVGLLALDCLVTPVALQQLSIDWRKRVLPIQFFALSLSNDFGRAFGVINSLCLLTDRTHRRDVLIHNPRKVIARVGRRGGSTSR
jgi:hypothetical protein